MKGLFQMKDQSQRWQSVVVEWLDITSHDGAWLELKEAEEYVPTPMKTMGYLLKEENDYIVVVSTVASTMDSVGSTNAIPRGCIQSITKLTKVDPVRDGGYKESPL